MSVTDITYTLIKRNPHEVYTPDWIRHTWSILFNPAVGIGRPDLKEGDTFTYLEDEYVIYRRQDNLLVLDDIPINSNAN